MGIKKEIIRKIERGIKLVIYFVFKLTYKPIRFNKKLIPSQIKKVFVVRDDKFGDLIVTIPTFRLLKELNPNMLIVLGCSVYNESLARVSPYIDDIVVSKNNLFDLKSLQLKHGYDFDLIINLVNNRVSKVLYNCKDFNKGIMTAQMDKNHLYSKLYTFNTTSHYNYKNMTQKQLSLVLDIFEANKRVEDCVVSIDYESIIDGYSSGIKGNYVVVNLSSGQEKNKISYRFYFDIVNFIVNETSYNILLIAMENEFELARKLKIISNRISINGKVENILEIGAIISTAKLLITPDTSLLHFACLNKTPLICIYRYDISNFEDWSPFNTKYLAIMAKEHQFVADIEFSENEERIGGFLKTID
jgi:ADP-heptose:LPS heptosyltransferase